MDEKIYIMKEGSAHGPFTRGEVQKKLLDDEFNLDMAAYTEGQERNPRTLRKILGISGGSTLKAPGGGNGDTDAQRRRAAAAAEINKLAKQEERVKNREMNRRSRGGGLKFLVLILLLLILGGGAFYYFYYLQEDYPLPDVVQNLWSGEEKENPATADAADPDEAEAVAGSEAEAAPSALRPPLTSPTGVPTVRVSGGGRIREAFAVRFQGEPMIVFNAAALVDGAAPDFTYGPARVGGDEVRVAFTSELAMVPATGRLTQQPLPPAASRGEMSPKVGDTVHVGFKSKTTMKILEVTPEFLRVQEPGSMPGGAPAVFVEGEKERVIGLYQEYRSPHEVASVVSQPLTREGQAFIWRLDTPARWVNFDPNEFTRQQKILDEVKLLTKNLSQLYQPGARIQSLEELRRVAGASHRVDPAFKSVVDRMESQAINNLAKESKDKLVRDTLGNFLGIINNDVQYARSQLTYGPLQLELIDQESARMSLKENLTSQRTLE